MASQKFFVTLKTVKRNRLSFLSPKSCQEISRSISEALISPSSTFLSNLNSAQLHQILSNPHIQPLKCLRFFNLISGNQSSIPFKADLQAHLTLISRLLEGRRFSEAENLLKSVSIEESSRYPFPLLASTIEKCCCFELKVTAKLFNLMLKVYSGNNKFYRVLETFDHMKNNGINIDERTCTMHLLALDKHDQMSLALEFFNRMIEFDIEVSAYSLMAVANGLCKIGEIKRCRALVEQMVSKGVHPNIATYNVILAACAKRWNFEELDSMLALMEKEGEAFNFITYKILIDGYSSYGKIEEAEKLVWEMHHRELSVDTHMYNLLINGYCKQNLVDKALLLFDKMSNRGVNSNVDTFGALIDGICKARRMEVAMVFVSKMQSQGIELDQVMLSSLVEGYCSKGMVDEAFELQVEMERRGFDSDISIWSQVLGALLRLKRNEEATELVNKLVRRCGSLEKFATLVKAGRKLI
ncbi:pentatricopeptide repeat-containing protein At2g28050 [Euphorbia lathyris]|uniref:pentatricopeptide repeat-containing protein At2g28050 n=1 Tax=Euphorbia lathyris TaxID=212925 RepID=UPI0033142272